MKNSDTAKKIAVLIDAENAQYTVLGAVLTELSKYGHIIVKKAYGDWSSNHLRNWKTPLNELAINPVQQFSYTQGKNSSDAAMIIDAMDLLYTEQFDAVALVTSDSDFTKLASRLKESQIYVFGVGEQKTPTAFRNACDDFILTEVLNALDDEKEETQKTPNSPSTRKSRKELCCDCKLIKTLRDAVDEYSDEDGWAELGPCGNLIKRQFSDFDPRNYGYRTLTQLFEATGLFETERRKEGRSNIVLIKHKKK